MYTYNDRLKHNEKDITNALNLINKLKVKRYFKSKKLYGRNHNYNLDSSGNPITEDEYIDEVGIIAQEVREIPELAYCVEGEEEGDLNIVNEDTTTSTITGDKELYLNYHNLFCYNIKATQELYKKVIELETIVNNQQKEITKLKLRK